MTRQFIRKHKRYIKILVNLRIKRNNVRHKIQHERETTDKTVEINQTKQGDYHGKSKKHKRKKDDSNQSKTENSNSEPTPSTRTCCPKSWNHEFVVFVRFVVEKIGDKML